MQDDGFIKSFDLQVSENSILITIPEMFKMNVDRSEKIFSIEIFLCCLGVLEFNPVP